MRPYVKSFVKLEWLIRPVVVENRAHPREKPLVSVVIPYYNRAATIDETLVSLETQTWVNFEVILVDDGSTEQESVDKLNKIDYPRLNLRILRQKNAGVAAARNTGISEAQGRYILCLDSDDMLEATYLEKAVISLETNANIDLVATDMRFFGVQNFVYKQGEYDPRELFNNNMIETAAMYRREAWERSGGYKSDIGYEDWEYWINLAENGFWGKIIPEPLFEYRTAISSRYIDDKAKHKINLRKIKELHPDYLRHIEKLARIKYFRPAQFKTDTRYVNLDRVDSYAPRTMHKKNVLVAVPWMTFGGAETLVLNFCREIKDDFNISFITGLESDNEWEGKFKEITKNIYHLNNLFEKKSEYIEFISNYITTRNIDTLHIVHTDFLFDILPDIKRKHPDLKVIVTLFNDRAGYIQQLENVQDCIDTLTADNKHVIDAYAEYGLTKPGLRLIPNGVDCYDKFDVAHFNRSAERAELGVSIKQKAVFFIGRLSEEKNPDVFVEMASEIIKKYPKGDEIFFIIGDGPMGRQIEKQIKSFNSPRLKYLGYQSDVAKYLSAADIFVLPSAVEGFPLSILEAMAMRVAVIASRVGAVPDVINDGQDGFVISPGSAREAIEVIQKLTKDDDELARVKSLARIKVEKLYSNVTLGKNYKNLYRRK